MSSPMGIVISVFNVILIRLSGKYLSAIGGPLTAFVLLASLPGFNLELSAHCPMIARLSTPIISLLGSSGLCLSVDLLEWPITLDFNLGVLWYIFLQHRHDWAFVIIIFILIHIFFFIRIIASTRVSDLTHWIGAPSGKLTYELFNFIHLILLSFSCQWLSCSFRRFLGFSQGSSLSDSSSDSLLDSSEELYVKDHFTWVVTWVQGHIPSLDYFLKVAIEAIPKFVYQFVQIAHKISKLV
ncbi:hypothetical protein EDD85DRAFT_785314 [Armillaria nabsnona]|nr:hypothetical protein EDD85DRAFT_785314 [Armillaria nabsnona]